MTINRRRFLETSAVGGVAVGVGLSAAGCGNDVSPARVTTVTIDDNPLSPTYGIITVPLAKYPQLQSVGGALTLYVTEPSSNADDRQYAIPQDNTVLLLQYTEKLFVTFQSSCPHAGCPLGYSKTDQLIECP